MPDRQDLKGVPEVVKAEAVIADTKTVLFRIGILQQLDVAFLR
jgi:hypothetical protein